MWGGVAVSACFVLLRIFSRFETSRKIFTDDILVIVAWLMQLGRSITLQCTKRAMFLQQASNEQEYLPHLPYAIATGILFLTGLWTIKLSFLLLARALVQRVSGPKRLWRWLTGITVASGVLCLVIPWWICLPGKDGKPNGMQTYF